MNRQARLAGFCILAAAIAVGTGDSGDAKKDTLPPPKLPRNWDRLDLTKEQTAKLYAISREYQRKIQAAEKRVDELKGAETAELITVLTAEQQAELLKRLTEKRESKKGDTKKGDTKKGELVLPPGWDSLSLTEEQRKNALRIQTKHKLGIAQSVGRLDDVRSEERYMQVKELNDAQKAMLLKGLTVGDTPQKVKDKQK
jgi:Spy/CpxP family protein refolding chaperone